MSVEVVAAVKADLERRGVSLVGAEGAGEIVKRVAWAMRATGTGLRIKPGGAGFDWRGQHYASDIISLADWDRLPDGTMGWKPNGINVDILGDAGGANTPAWSPYPIDLSVVKFHQVAIDPEDAPAPGPTPPPPPPSVPLDDRVHNIELQLASIGGVVNQLYAGQAKQATSEQIAALETRTNTSIQAAIKQIVAAIPNFGRFFGGTR